MRIFCVMTYRSSCCFFFHFLLHLSLIHQFITLIVRFKMLFKRWFFVFFLCQTRLFAWQNRSQTLNGVPFEFWACVCFWICLWLIAIDEFHKLIDFWCAHTHSTQPVQAANKKQCRYHVWFLWFLLWCDRDFKQPQNRCRSTAFNFWSANKSERIKSRIIASRINLYKKEWRLRLWDYDRSYIDFKWYDFEIETGFARCSFVWSDKTNQQ